ncbi:MAG: hypothetical protein V5A55_04290 [Halovenus sp.]
MCNVFDTDMYTERHEKFDDHGRELLPASTMGRLDRQRRQTAM